MKKAIISVLISFIIMNFLLPVHHGQAAQDNPFQPTAETKATDQKAKDDLAEDDVPVQFENPITLLTMLKMLASLLFVIALIYGLLKFINSRANPFTGYRSLENVGGLSLGGNRSVQLVKIGERLLVVGVGETITLLKEIDDEEELKALLKGKEDQQPIHSPFVTLQSYLKQKTNQNVKPEHKENEFSSSTFTEMLKTQLKKSANDRHSIVNKQKEDQQQ